MMGTRGKINAIWWKIKINLQKLVNICGYELPTNLQNFVQNDHHSENKLKSFKGGGYFFPKHSVYIEDGKYRANVEIWYFWYKFAPKGQIPWTFCMKFGLWRDSAKDSP